MSIPTKLTSLLFALSCFIVACSKDTHNDNQAKEKKSATAMDKETLSLRALTPEFKGESQTLEMPELKNRNLDDLWRPRIYKHPEQHQFEDKYSSGFMFQMLGTMNPVKIEIAPTPRGRELVGVRVLDVEPKIITTGQGKIITIRVLVGRTADDKESARQEHAASMNQQKINLKPVAPKRIGPPEEFEILDMKNKKPAVLWLSGLLEEILRTQSSVKFELRFSDQEHILIGSVEPTVFKKGATITITVLGQTKIAN